MMNFFKHLFGPKQDASTNRSNHSGESNSEDFEYIFDHAHALVRGGYYSQADAVDSLDDWIKDEGLELSAENIIRSEIDALEKDQTSWPETTDYDRLHEAMLDLEKNGIVAREDFTCCGTCGVAEIGDEIQSFNQNGRTAKGFTFFHQQDTESAVQGYGLYLNYGTAQNGGTDDDSVKIGHEIAQTMKDHGLDVDWDGDLGKRIGVKLDWKRRWNPNPHDS